jgi:hypothetical protein
MTADRKTGCKAPQTGNLEQAYIPVCSALPTYRFTSGGKIPKNRKGKGLMREMSTWEENINMDLKETGCEDAGCVRLAQNWEQGGALANMEENFGNFFIS